MVDLKDFYGMLRYIRVAVGHFYRPRVDAHPILVACSLRHCGSGSGPISVVFGHIRCLQCWEY